MRSSVPFFSSASATTFIDELAECEQPLLIYCGAGVSIDRTGLSWAGLVRSCFPTRHSKNYPVGPTSLQLQNATELAPDQLASSLVHTLRAVAAGSSSSLRDTLRNRIKRSLYGDKASWQAGELVPNLIQLAVLRSFDGRKTTIVTTNYDDHLEAGYELLRRDIEALPMETTFPGMRVAVVSTEGEAKGDVPTAVVVDHKPINMRNAEAATISLTYLHGRVPRKGDVSWPIVLDENSYASTARSVGRTLRHVLNECAMTVIVGSSLQDAPLVRALSDTRKVGSRVAIMTKQGFPTAFDDEGNALALELATHRASELGVRAIFADFHGQVAQLFHEAFIRTAFRTPKPDIEWTSDYTTRLARWWERWMTSNGIDPSLPDALRSGLSGALPVIGISSAPDPLNRAAERFRLELWVRSYPRRPERHLVRWASSDGAALEGVNGKQGQIESPSYLAAVRAFTEGRPSAFDIASLEQGRASTGRYTSKSFLAIPIRVDNVIVGTLTLASTARLGDSLMMNSKESTAELVTLLSEIGQDMLKVSAS